MRASNMLHNSGNRAANEQGVAMLTVLLIMLMMTVLGVAALTVTGFESRMAGFVTSTESATTAAEACTGTAVNVLQQTIDPYVGGGIVPAAFLSNATPAGPVPQENAPFLSQEIMGQLDNDLDVPVGPAVPPFFVRPNLDQTVGAYRVRGDIDRLYLKGKAGSGMQQFAGYEGTGNSAVGSSDVYYRVDCIAENTATGTSARVTAVYACTLTGETCQK